MGLNTAFGSRLETKKGKLTGRLTLNLTQPDQKQRLLRQYATRHRINLQESLCFGDMILDEAMMRTVSHPVALNAGPALRKACRKNRWPLWREKDILKKVRKLA